MGWANTQRTQCRPAQYPVQRGRQCATHAAQHRLRRSTLALPPLRLQVFHTAATRPPPQCESCYACQKRRILGKGTPLLKVFVGCTDVEGVQENSVDPPELCDDTQRRPIPRPSEALIKK